MSYGSCALCASPAVTVDDGVPICARDAQILGVPVGSAEERDAAAAIVHDAVVDHMTAYEASRG